MSGIARAITDLLLSRAEGHARRFYSMSSSIMQHRRDYYDVLERTQHGDGEITDWLQWFLACLSETIEAVLERISTAFHKHHFFHAHRTMAMNERQRLLISRLFDGLEGKLTVAKWAKLAKCSRTEAEADIADLVSIGILREDRSTRHISYSLEAEAL